MKIFRRLAGNIFFKIILAFVALSFVLFGISGFLLGNPDSWVVKIGSTSVGQNTFLKAMQNDREVILASSKSEEALKYVESERFKSDVLGRLVNKIMIEKLRSDFGVTASRKLILEAIAKDRGFKNKDGKFDQELFKKFLARNGLSEEKYLNEIANDVTATMIIQSLSMAAPLDDNTILETENFKQEKRLADTITISIKEIGNIEKPSDEEVQKFFAENKKIYSAPEIRRVSYLHFSKNDFAKDWQISESEVAAEYEKNKNNLLTQEQRDFYHVVFDKEEAAKDFLKKFDEAVASDKSKSKTQFARLAKEIQNKDLKTITLSKITKRDFIPELTEPTFKLALNERSAPVKSPLGFHIFLLTELKESKPIPFAEAKIGIKQKMLAGREEKILQSKISEIDDALLTSNSLVEVAKKFGLKASSAPVTIDQVGQNEKGELVNEIKTFGNFVENAFALKKAQTSKIFYAKNSNEFYALKLEEIIPAHEKELAAVKSRVYDDVIKVKRNQALQILAQKIGDEIKANPEQASQIASKYKAKFEKNREFPRMVYMNFQGRQVPYQSKFLDELFGLKIGQTTSVTPAGTQEFTIAVLRQIKSATANSQQFEQAKQQAAEGFRGEILQEYNSLLLKKNPVKVNEKILGKKEEK
jgi:peptidyl-prolyl cis-trans isomerase D